MTHARRGPRTLFSLGLLLVSLADSPPRGYVIPIPTIRHAATTHGPGTPRDTAWRVRPASVMAGPTGDSSFVQITAVALDSLGQVFIADGDGLHLADTGGKYLAHAARRGRGPGEVMFVAGLIGLPRGGVWAIDYATSRYTRFGPGGSDLHGQARILTRSYVPWPGGATHRGFIDVDRGSAGAVMVVTDTAWVPASRLSLPETPAEVHVPFAPKSLIQAVHDGVWFGFNASGTIHKLSLTGDTMARIVLSRPAARVTAAERAEAIAAWRARLGRMGAGPGSAPAPELPTRKPIYSRFIPSSDGGLGVVPVVNPRRQDSEIDLFDRTGRFRGTAHLPFRLAAVAAGVVLGQRLLLALEMPNGEERVYRFDLVP